MGAVPSKCDGDTGEPGLQQSESESGQDDKQRMIEEDGIKKWSSNRRQSSGGTVHCPTCQGTGRIPRGSEHEHLTQNSLNSNLLKKHMGDN